MDKEQKKQYNKEWRLKNKEYYKEYESRPKVKEHRKEHRKEYKSRPKVKEHLKEYNKKYKKEYRSKPENKIHQKEYNDNNPQVFLKSKIKTLKKHAIPLKLTHWQYGYALMAWSKAVRKRNKVCVMCGSNKSLEAHHIFEKAKYPQLSLNLNNGITLCKLHHDEVHRLNN